MFDIGFTEIVVIAVVALIVIGPERLPKTARTLGHLFGRLQRYVNDVKSDISREMELEELRKLQQEMKSAASDLESSMTAAARDVESGMRGVEAQLNAGASETPAPAPVQASEFAAPSSSPSAEAHPPEPARQPSLPGFDKI
jgi:sec-independent protein translocase protein TatB